MASTPADVLWEYDPFIRTFKDGRRLRIRPDVFTRPTCVNSKDILITPEHSAVTIENSNIFCQESVLSARLYLPKGANIYSKLPLLIYFHGGGFCIESAFCATYHNYLNYLVEKANVVAVSVNYRRASEFPVPFAFEDSWTAVRWVFAQQPKEFSPPQEQWLRDYANFDKVYMAGDSAGATITHNMAVRAGTDPKFNGKFSGILVVHPYFLGSQPIPGEGSEMDDMLKLWFAIQTTRTGCEDPSLDDPLINPIKDPNFSKLAPKRVLVCVAEKDGLVHRGKLYYDELMKSEWVKGGGVVELFESFGEGHVFHTSKLISAKADELMKKDAKILFGIKEGNKLIGNFGVRGVSISSISLFGDITDHIGHNCECGYRHKIASFSLSSRVGMTKSDPKNYVHSPATATTASELTVSEGYDNGAFPRCILALEVQAMVLLLNVVLVFFAFVATGIYNIT
ncbi:hypothetical protein IFM89_004456 [Coptis chinensis]|uniref:Alpha/beta hydrolase fold-3 domain-containing protein n=1 Tax=Coptis chinensis TaxID=261450 RepID=A0A835GUK3_9MAGN|nr:hypothetical protein IFM89_004456 [Coptis chinensis]